MQKTHTDEIQQSIASATVGRTIGTGDGTKYVADV
jgi:hypothetical protein